MLSFAYKRFDGHVPERGELDDEYQSLLMKVEARFETAGVLYNACKFRAALGEAMALAREAIGYAFAVLSAGLDRKAPWFQIKEDPQALREPTPLFKKLDESVVEEEYARMEGSTGSKELEKQGAGARAPALSYQSDVGVRVPRLLAVAAVFGQPLAGDGDDALGADHTPPAVGDHPPKGAAPLAHVPEQPGWHAWRACLLYHRRARPNAHGLN